MPHASEKKRQGITSNLKSATRRNVMIAAAILNVKLPIFRRMIGSGEHKPVVIFSEGALKGRQIELKSGEFGEGSGVGTRTDRTLRCPRRSARTSPAPEHAVVQRSRPWSWRQKAVLSNERRLRPAEMKTRQIGKGKPVSEQELPA